MSRAEILLSMFDASGRGLEIGPSFNPLLPKSAGHHVEILDHLTAGELREKYRDAGVDLGRIEEVDHVSDGGSIAKLIAKPSHYDYCVALHVIEHTVDLLGFLKDCEELLKPGGVLVLAVPDKRFSFDVLRPISSTGDVVQAHLEGRTRHPLGKMFDEFAYNCLRAGLPAWGRAEHGALSFFRSMEDAAAMLSHVQKTGEFIDIHAWQFTPSSFRLIVQDLNKMGMIGLKERRFAEAGGEFYMILSRDAHGCLESSIELAKRAIREQAEIAT